MGRKTEVGKGGSEGKGGGDGVSRLGVRHKERDDGSENTHN